LLATAAAVFVVCPVLVAVTEVQPAAASGTVNIGFICDCNDGTLSSSDSVTQPTMEAWASYVNAHGGLDGEHVNVIYEDPHMSDGTATAEAETLVSDHVIAIVDVTSSDNVWASIVQQAGIPVVGGNTSSETFTTNPDFFAVGETLDAYFTNFVAAAKKAGAKSLGELYCAEAVTCQEAVAPLKAAAAKENMPLSYVTSISASSPNFTAPCLAAEQAKVQALIVADAVSIVESVASSCNQQGYKPYYVALDGAISISMTKTPGLQTSLVGSEPNIPFWVTDTPATETLHSALEKYQPALLKNPNFSELVTQAWASGLLISDAAKAGHLGSGGKATAAQLKAGLYDLHGDTLGGMAPPLTFKKGVPNPIDCWYWMRIQNKKFTTPYGLAPVCVHVSS